MSRVRRLTARLLALLVLPAAGGAWAETAPAEFGPPTEVRAAEASGRWIETIRVEGLSFASSALVVSESRLAGGRPYTEVELRDAVHRVRRLPFVRDADFAVRRGSVRGRYVLVIRVEETRRVFLGEDAVVTRTDAPLALGRGQPERETARVAPQVGGRLFLGRYNVLFGSVGGGEGAQLGYQRYNLFGRGGVLGIAVQQADCCATRLHDAGLDPTLSIWRDEGDRQQLDLDVGMPLRGNQALRVAYSHGRSDGGIRRFSVFDPESISPGTRPSEFLYEDLRRHRLEVAWRYDSTDDPLFPHHGAILEGGFEVATLAAEQGADLALIDPSTRDASTLLTETRTSQFRLLLSASQTWSVGRRHAVSLGVRGAMGRARLEGLPVGVELVNDQARPTVVDRTDVDTWSVGVSAGYRVSLLQAQRARRLGDLYWQARLSFDLDRADLDSGTVSLGRLDTLRFETSIAFRSAWGLFRLTLQWVELSS